MRIAVTEYYAKKLSDFRAAFFDGGSMTDTGTAYSIPRTCFSHAQAAAGVSSSGGYGRWGLSGCFGIPTLGRRVIRLID